MDNWLNILQTFGLATMILLAAGVGLWKAARWVAAEIIIPIRDRMISNLDQTLAHIEQTLDRLEENVERMVHSLDQQHQQHMRMLDEFQVRTQAQAVTLARDLAERNKQKSQGSTP